jgi:hypothetical protein
MAKTYKSEKAARLHRRATAKPASRPAKRVGEGRHAHPQPRGGQERKGKA